MKKRLTAWMLTAVLALTGLSGMQASAAPGQEDVKVNITKKLVMDSEVKTNPAAKFVFKFEQIKAEDIGQQPNPVVDIKPDGGGIDPQNNPVAIADVTITYAQGDSARAVENNLATYERTVPVPDMVGSKFTVPGVYAYKVTEKPLTTDVGNSTWTKVETSTEIEEYLVASKAEYTLYVLVARKTDSNDLYISDVVYYQNKDDLGQPTDTKIEVEAGKGVPFRNVYEKDSSTGRDEDPTKASLIIAKTVSGNAADYEKEFDFKVEISKNATTELLPDTGSEPPKTYVGKVYDTKLGNPVNPEKTVSVKAGNPAVDFKLKAGQELRFDYIPVGATYKAYEDTTNAPGYTVTYSGIVGGKTVPDKTPGTGVTEGQIAMDKTYDHFTVNNDADITVTGIVTDNLPFLLLIVAAVAGIVLYAGFRRRFRAK